MRWNLDEEKFLTPRELRVLRAAARKCSVRDWFVLELGLATGLRVSEMAALKFGDFSVGGGRASVLVRNGKGGRSRVVRFPTRFKVSLNRYIRWKRKAGEETDSGAFVFHSTRTGGALSTRTLQKSFKRVLEAADLDAERFSIHCLRHTYAANLYKASGWNLRLVQRQLGHSTIAVTEVYANLFHPDIDAAVNNLYRI